MFEEFLVKDILQSNVAINKEQADKLYEVIKNHKKFKLDFTGINVVSRRFIFEVLGETQKYKEDYKIVGLEPSREKRIKELLHDFKVMNI